MPNKNLPDWYTPEAAPAAAPVNAKLPDWYQPEPQAPKPAAAPTDYGAAKNFLTGLMRVPGAIAGTPAMIGHTANWAQAQFNNGLDAVLGVKKDKPTTGADLDKLDPVMGVLPTAEGVDKAVFGATGVEPYQPTSPLGQMGQAAVTAGVTGFRDPRSLLSLAKGGQGALRAFLDYAKGSAAPVTKLAAAGATAQGSQQLFPDTPGLAALTAFLTHAGVGAAGQGAKAGYRTFVEPLIDPRGAAEPLAGRALTAVDHTQPGVAAPSTLDLTRAEDQSRLATADIGPGADNYNAGGAIRADLQGRKDALTQGRRDAADVAYDQFRGQPPMPGVEIGPFMSSPDFRAAVKEASTGRLNRGQKPLTDLFHFDPANAGEPTIIPNAAIPPDVLQRIKGALDDAVDGAGGNVRRADLKDLRQRFLDVVDARYPQTYPSARGEFAAKSRPLDPLETGAPERVLDSETNFGRRSYSMPQERVTDTFLSSKALRTNFDELIAAYGGDKKAALAHLEENLANKVQGAINGDGTLSLDAFNRAVRPYTKALNMWFPNLAQKFSSAEAAQRTLETVRAQRELSGSIEQGAMRNTDGFVTRSSAQKWLSQNEDALGRTQAKGAIMRLRQIVDALPDAPGAGAEAAVEAAPMALGTASAGLEGGVLGGITHKIPAYLAGPRLARFREHYSRAVEKAITDPIEAQRLVALAAKRGGPKKLGVILKEEAMKAAKATPAATIAASASDQSQP